MIDIEIWSDFACPFCYIGETRLDHAIRDLGMEDKVNVRYRAFELDHKKHPYASLAIDEVYINKFHMSRADAENHVEHVQKIMRGLGLDCNYHESHPSNTFDAHRLIKLAEAKYGKATVHILNTALFDAYFARSLVLSDHKVLEQIGRNAGMKEEEIKTMLNSNLFAEAVEADERVAEEYGITGVPYFLTDDRLAVPGAISIEDFKELLLSLVAEKKEQVAETPLIGKRPHRCTEEGCELI